MLLTCAIFRGAGGGQDIGQVQMAKPGFKVKADHMQSPGLFTTESESTPGDFMCYTGEIFTYNSYISILFPIRKIQFSYL